ncbi:MAG: GGDEF domain-containing protein [Planctomycetota bacterium]
MSKSSRFWAMGLYWIPFIAGLGSACTYVVFLVTNWGDPHAGLVVTLVLGVVIGLLAVALAIFAAADARALAESRQHEKQLEDRLASAHNQARQLSSHLEVLTAMREVTRILSDAVDLKQIAKSVFDVLEPLLGTEEIALILRDEEGRLALKALRSNGETLYDDALTGTEVDLSDAAEALQHQTLAKATDGSTGTFCVPLVADQNPVGVMRFEIPLDGTPDEKEEKINELELVLGDIAKHLALVVKTPSLHDRAIIDSLTGLFTRRHFDIRIDDMFRLARRYATPFSLILLDIDHFKSVNDTHGHRAGDVVLRELAALLTNGIRDCDSAFRYGGEEFAVLLPETSADQAQSIAERLRSDTETNPVQADDNEVSVTVSLGVAQYSPALANHGELIALADHALYRAKQGGRNRVVVSEEPSPGDTAKEEG